MYWNTCFGAVNRPAVGDQYVFDRCLEARQWWRGRDSFAVSYPSWPTTGISVTTPATISGIIMGFDISPLSKSLVSSRTLQNNGAERLPVRPFWLYEMPPKIVADPNTPTETYPLFFADTFTVRSRSGLPAQTFFLFTTQYLDFSKYSRARTFHGRMHRQLPCQLSPAAWLNFSSTPGGIGQVSARYSCSRMMRPIMRIPPSRTGRPSLDNPRPG